MSSVPTSSDSHLGRVLRNEKEPVGRITEAEWTITVEEPFQHPMDRVRSPSDVSIFRVPNVLMKESEKGEAYIPQRVSLGPYHQTNAKLHSMDIHKRRAMNRMMTRLNKNKSVANDPTNMELCVRAKEKICELENEIRKRYEEEINLDGETLGLMLSLDGCFILEILRLRIVDGVSHEPSKAGKCYEPIFNLTKIGYIGGDIIDDILKLENQIPLIVLQKLLEMELKSTDLKRNLLMLMYTLMEIIYPFDKKYVDEHFNKLLQEGAQPQEFDHLLGFWHSLIVGDDTSRLAHQDDETSLLQRLVEYCSPLRRAGYRELPHQEQDSASLPQHAGYTELSHPDQDSPLNGEDRDRNHDRTVNGVDQDSAANGVDQDSAVNGESRSLDPCVDADMAHPTTVRGAGEGHHNPAAQFTRSRDIWGDADMVHPTTGRDAGEGHHNTAAQFMRSRDIWGDADIVHPTTRMRDPWGASQWTFNTGEDIPVKEPESNIHRAVELANAGIKFEQCKGGIKEIHFDSSKATIYLPVITITDPTEVLFRNLIAFEMCKPSKPNYVACYVCLMDQLIDSEADVAFLRKKGIVKNSLGSDKEVAKLFNGLCKGVTVSLKGVFNNLAQEVNKHYTNKFYVQCAQFLKEYFSSVWKALAWAGAIFVVLLAVVQTIFAIIAVYK